MAISNLTSKQIKDLNWANKANQNIQFGTLLDSLITAAQAIRITASSSAITTATGAITITLNHANANLATTDFSVYVGANELVDTTDYTVTNPTTVSVTITFKAHAGLTNASVITLKIVKNGYVYNEGFAIPVTNSIS